MRALLLFLAFAGAAHGQTTFTLQPARAQGGQAVALRMDDPSGCVPAPQIDVERQGNIVNVEVQLTDAGPCLPQWATPRLIPLGTFTPGIYEVRAILCANAPPPEPECALDSTHPLRVFGTTGTRFTVPTLSTWAAILLGSGMLLAAWGRRGGPTRGWAGPQARSGIRRWYR